MDSFETIRTMFKVVALALTQNRLIIIGLVALFLFIAWCVLSLIFNKVVKFNKNALKTIEFVKKNGVSGENYSQFVEVFKNFSTEMCFSWKRYELKRKGVASDYLNKNECIDLPLLGGIQKQSRSLLRSTIYCITLILTIFSIAIIGTTGKAGVVDTPLTTLLFAEALIVPLLFAILMFVVYYIYTSIRNNEYKIACDYFYDLLDCLDDKVDLSVVFDGDTRQVGLISNIFSNDTVEDLNEKARKRPKNKEVKEVRVGKSTMSPLKAGVIGSKEMPKTYENVLKSETTQTNNEPQVEMTANFKIKNEVHFIEVINCVEVLLNRIENERDKEKKQALEKEVNVMIKALTEFKQKAKEHQAKKTIKNPSKQ